MKPAILPTVCGAALAIMAGAASTHFMSVRQIVALAEQSTPIKHEIKQPVAVSETEAMIALLRKENQSLQGTLDHTKAALSANHHPTQAATTAPASGSDRILSELIAMNRELRNQVAETNRDLMELQFRVDTHSEQFRPLNITEQRMDDPLGAPDYDTSIGVLPPMDMP